MAKPGGGFAAQFWTFSLQFAGARIVNVLLLRCARLRLPWHTPFLIGGKRLANRPDIRSHREKIPEHAAMVPARSNSLLRFQLPSARRNPAFEPAAMC